MALQGWFLMVGIEGLFLTDSDRRRLMHSRTGAVLLFARNYQSREQLAQLTQQIKSLRSLPIFVDQEGGVVQRFRQDFTRLPSMQVLGQQYECSEENGLALATACGQVMAYELAMSGVDCSFAPVVDLDHGHSEIIGSRSFSGNPEHVSALASALRAGMELVGMSAVIKHFPGHGYVSADSHLEMPMDERDLLDFVNADLVPFQHLINHQVEGVMVAHLTVPQFDSASAGFSQKWIGYLRNTMGFDGTIFSDDMSMHAVTHLSLSERIQQSVSAGCQGIICANDNPELDEYLASQSSETLQGTVMDCSDWFCQKCLSDGDYWESLKRIESLNEER